MNIGRPVADFAKELVRQAHTKRDFIASTPTLQMLIDAGAVSEPVNLAAAIRNTEAKPPEVRRPASYNLKVGGYGPFGIQNLTHEQIAQFCKIPKQYYDRMRNDEPQLLIENVHTWLKRTDLFADRMIRTLDGRARAFLSNGYRPLDNVDLFKAIVPVIAEADALIDSCELTETKLYVKCTSHKITIQPKVGDIIEAGILVKNSEVGLGRIEVGPFLKRLACMNGMAVDDFAFKRRHVGKRSGRRGADLSDDVAVDGGNAGGSGGAIPEEWFSDDTRKKDDAAFFAKIQDVVRASFSPDKFAEIAKRVTDSTTRTMDGNPINVVKAVKNDYLLTDDEEGSVLRHLIEGGDLSQWGLANAVTRLAGDVKDYDRATELERAGGQVMQLPDNDWEALLQDAKKLAA